MVLVSFLERYFAVGVAILGGIIGFSVYGMDNGFLWLIIGYFIGKTVQSSFWALRVDSRT